MLKKKKKKEKIKWISKMCFYYDKFKWNASQKKISCHEESHENPMILRNPTLCTIKNIEINGKFVTDNPQKIRNPKRALFLELCRWITSFLMSSMPQTYEWKFHCGLWIFQGSCADFQDFQGFQGHSFKFKAFQGFQGFQGPLATLLQRVTFFPHF